MKWGGRRADQSGVGGEAKGGMEGGRTEKADEVSEIEGPRDPCPGEAPTKEGREREEAEEDGVVEGKDAEGSADVEALKAAVGVAAIDEDAGDEEAGEDEEEVDAGPAPGEVEVVMGEDEQEGGCAEAVECGVVGAVGGLSFWGVGGDGERRSGWGH